MRVVSAGASRGGRNAKASAPRRQLPLKAIAIALAAVVALFIAGAAAIVVLSHTDAFTISSISAEPTEHISAEDIAALAGVPEGTTLLNYDEALIVNNLRRNPWVKDVKLSREFPDRLRVEITERTVTSIVMMNSGSVTWCMGDDDVWIEPVKIVAGEGQSIIEAALAYVSGSETLVITDVPQTVNPVAGTVAEDEVFEAIRAYRTELSKDFWDQIVSINASSIEGISCVLKSGIEISLGVPSNIETKEAVIDQLMAKYPNRLTYINVRVPSNPSYRMVDTESVEGGCGATGDISAATPSATTEPTKTQGEQNESSGSESAEGTAEATESYDEWTDTSDEWTDGSGEWTEGYDDYADTYGEWTEGYDESTETYDEWTEGY